MEVPYLYSRCILEPPKELSDLFRDLSLLLLEEINLPESGVVISKGYEEFMFVIRRFPDLTNI